MRWCHSCRQYNQGWPVRCRYCSAGLDGRLCPRNHVNPADRRLGFCGECGQPLDQVWGAGFSVRPYLVSFGILLLAILGAGTMLVIGDLVERLR